LANCQLPENQTPNPLPQKQSFWDRPGIQLDRAIFETSLTSAFQQASYLAATSRHSGDWLFSLPIASCGLKINYRLSGWLSTYGWASTSASRINAAAEHQLTPVACTALAVSRHRAKLLDTMLLTTWLLGHSPQLAFQCAKS